MSERYDARTVAFLLDEFTRLVETIRGGGWGAIAGAMLGTLKRLATEAESREPDLADWIRAAMSSKLGPMTMGAYEDSWALFWGDGFMAGLTGAFVHFVERIDGAVCAFIGNSIDSFATPAELTAALDRIAEESSNG